MQTIEHPQAHRRRVERAHTEAKRFGGGAATFWAKINADWIFNWSAMLAYNFLTSIFPLMLVILAIAGLMLGYISPVTLNSLENSMANALPAGIGHTVVTAATTSLRRNAGVILAIGVITAIFGGSRLFVAIENAFTVIFRLHPRDFIRQNAVAILMTIVLAIGGPLLFLADILPSFALKTLSSAAPGPITSLFVEVVGLLIGFVVAAILFGAIYVVMPNQRVVWRDVWKGAVVAAALLVVYEILFPIYESLLLHPGNYGSLAGFALLLLAFLYYLSFILLLGAEINAWALGHRTPSSELVIYTQPEKAPSDRAHGRHPEHHAHELNAQSDSRQEQQPQQPRARQPEARSALTDAPAAMTLRTHRPAYKSAASRGDEPVTTSPFSLTTALAAALTAISVIIFEFSRPRRPRHA